MAHTDIYRKQHKELLDLVAKMRAIMDPKTIAADASQVNTLLCQFAGKLRIHLVTEDKGLYPQLRALPIPELKTKAQKYQDEMGGILRAFGDYMNHYNSAKAIQEAPVAFVKDTGQLFEILGRRIQAEDNDLYALVDKTL